MKSLLKTPSTDFNAVRDGRNSLPLYIDIDLSAARDKATNTQLVVGIAGNSFYADADTANGGNAVVTFQDTNLGESGAPFFISPGFIANVGFTQLLIENTAQAGKRLRIFYGVDIDFQAGVNSSIAISGSVAISKPAQVTFINSSVNVTNVSASLLSASPTRAYLLIQNNDPVGNIYIRYGGAAGLTIGIKIGPGGSYEQSGTVIGTNQIFAISDIPSVPNVQIVQGFA